MEYNTPMLLMVGSAQSLVLGTVQLIEGVNDNFITDCSRAGDGPGIC
jgi:hypothetical protein